MAPVFDKTPPLIVYETIKNYKLPVWIDRGDGKNAAVSINYEESLGIAFGDESWKLAVQNKEYAETYKEFINKGPCNDIWEHVLEWKRPDNGELETHFCSAHWIELNGKNYIWGEVTLNHKLIEIPEELPKIPWWAIVAQNISVFIFGVLIGILLNRYIP